jgi:hypothetical protein
MKSTILLLCISILSLVSLAQPIRTEPTPITRQDALKLRNIQELLGIPATDSIIKGTMSMVSRKDRTDLPWRPNRGGLADPSFNDMISNARSGERLIFSGFIALEGDKQIKVETKTFVFK